MTLPYAVTCASCGETVRRDSGDPYLNAVAHLAECGALQLAVLDYSKLDDDLDEAEAERRERM